MAKTIDIKKASEALQKRINQNGTTAYNGSGTTTYQASAATNPTTTNPATTNHTVLQGVGATVLQGANQLRNGTAGGNIKQPTNGVTGGTYSPTYGNYTIGSDYGKQQAQNMAIGTKWVASDGALWTKEKDGSITVDYNGVITKNAYTPTDQGILGQRQMDANLPWRDVYATYLARQNKAMNTPGLEEFANDPVAQEMWNYIMEGMRAEYRPETSGQEIMQSYEWIKPTYEDGYDPEVQELLDRILNREDFSYDVTKDPLYQQYADMYQREGDRAMRETMAEAAASAGGMNSYAMTAAQQANNYYNAQLNDRIPELYQLAYDMYLKDKESDIQNLGILQNMSDRDYARYRDTMSDWWNDRNFAYGAYRDDVADSRWNQEFDYNATINDRDFNYGVNQDFLSNEWKEREWNRIQEESAYDRSQYEDDKAYERAQAEKKDAYNRVVDAVANGASMASIDADLIQQAGLSMAIVKDWITKRDSENFKRASSAAGGGGGSRKNEDEEDEETSNMSWTQDVLDLGLPMATSPIVLEKLLGEGAIYEKNGKMYWSNSLIGQTERARLTDGNIQL